MLPSVRSIRIVLQSQVLSIKEIGNKGLDSSFRRTSSFSAFSIDLSSPVQSIQWS